MKIKNIIGYAVIVACCLVASGCFSIEQEIFLNADGSGDLVVFISLPDLPEKVGGAELTSKKSPADALAEFTQREPRGEIVIVVEGFVPSPQETWDEDRVRAALGERIAAGESRSSAAKSVADESGWPRRDVYDLDI